MSGYDEILKNSSHVRELERGGALRIFVAFILLAAALAAVIVPAYNAKIAAAHILYEDLTFTRIAVEARQHIQKIEYGLRNGRELRQFFNINTILRDILRCSSYVEGVYVVGRGETLLYSLERRSLSVAPLRLPREPAFENENDYALLEGLGFFDLLLPVYDAGADGPAYVVVRLDSDVVLFSTRDLILQEYTQSLVIAALMLGLGTIVFLRYAHGTGKKPKPVVIGSLVFLFAFLALSLDLGISYARYSGIAESATVQSVNRIARMLQSDLDTLRSIGVSADSIHDQNSWLRKSVSGIPMIHTMSINSNMRITLTASQEYINRFGTGLLSSYAVIYAALLILAATTAAGRAIYRKIRNVRK